MMATCKVTIAGPATMAHNWAIFHFRAGPALAEHDGAVMSASAGPAVGRRGMLTGKLSVQGRNHKVETSKGVKQHL